MRKLLNTLFVTTPEAYISKDGQNVVISLNQREIFRIPALNLEAIITFGYMGASPGVMKLCCDNGIALTFLSPSGQFIGRLQGPVKGNVLLRTRQYQIANDPNQALPIAKICIAAKIQNYRNILRRFIRDYGQNDPVTAAADALDNFKRQALHTSDAQSLIGIEGIASNAYFAVLPHLILQQKADFPFSGRNRRPPKDAVNALLSFAYTLITHDMTAALESVGLDPYVGFLHALRPGRTSLALDLIEELRAYLGDRFILSLINKRQITPAHFIQQAQTITLTDEGRKAIITAWQQRKRETITHPFLNQTIEIGLLPYIQAMLLARFIRTDIDAYPPFLIK